MFWGLILGATAISTMKKNRLITEEIQRQRYRELENRLIEYDRWDKEIFDLNHDYSDCDFSVDYEDPVFVDYRGCVCNDNIIKIFNLKKEIKEFEQTIYEKHFENEIEKEKRNIYKDSIEIIKEDIKRYDKIIEIEDKKEYLNQYENNNDNTEFNKVINSSTELKKEILILEKEIQLLNEDMERFKNFINFINNEIEIKEEDIKQIRTILKENIKKYTSIRLILNLHRGKEYISDFLFINWFNEYDERPVKYETLFSDYEMMLMKIEKYEVIHRVFTKIDNEHKSDFEKEIEKYQQMLKNEEEEINKIYLLIKNIEKKIKMCQQIIELINKKNEIEIGENIENEKAHIDMMINLFKIEREKDIQEKDLNNYNKEIKSHKEIINEYVEQINKYQQMLKDEEKMKKVYEYLINYFKIEDELNIKEKKVLEENYVKDIEESQQLLQSEKIKLQKIIKNEGNITSYNQMIVIDNEKKEKEIIEDNIKQYEQNIEKYNGILQRNEENFNLFKIKLNQIITKIEEIIGIKEICRWLIENKKGEIEYYEKYIDDLKKIHDDEYKLKKEKIFYKGIIHE